MTPFELHIVGAGRGGTSLLAGLIDAHPEWEVHFEQFARQFLMGEVHTDAEDESALEPRTRKRVDNFLAACAERAASVANKRWGHKTTTEQIAGLHNWRGLTISSAAEGFDPIVYFLHRTAQIPTIFIVRDGRTCVASKIKRTGQPVEQAIARWKFSVDVLRHMHVCCERLLVVRMEDLIDSPDAELNRVCQFLGMPFDVRMLEGTQNPKMRSEYQRSGFERGPVETQGIAFPWTEEIRSDLDYCGYR